MFRPKRSAYYTGSYGCDEDVEAGVERGEGADEAVEGMFGGVIDGCREGGCLAGYGGDVKD